MGSLPSASHAALSTRHSLSHLLLTITLQNEPHFIGEETTSGSFSPKVPQQAGDRASSRGTMGSEVPARNHAALPSRVLPRGPVFWIPGGLLASSARTSRIDGTELPAPPSCPPLPGPQAGGRPVVAPGREVRSPLARAPARRPVSGACGATGGPAAVSHRPAGPRSPPHTPHTPPPCGPAGEQCHCRCRNEVTFQSLEGEQPWPAPWDPGGRHGGLAPPGPEGGFCGEQRLVTFGRSGGRFRLTLVPSSGALVPAATVCCPVG